VTVTLGTVLLFFAGQPIALVALGAAGVLMLDRTRPEKVYRIVDWPLLVMFSGLFVVVHAFEVNVVHAWGLDRWRGLERSPVVMVGGLSVVLSNLVSNVPAVLLFKPLIDPIPQAEQAWLAFPLRRHGHVKMPHDIRICCDRRSQSCLGQMRLPP
jgi:Na+/H+ antiporter NhaD/arsenite permease-like protein